uniref:FHA domain-containing protein n=1 Tax=Panagrellus redivivus TaxID=6233 RepID=A0A7E4VT46_PANRE
TGRGTPLSPSPALATRTLADWTDRGRDSRPMDAPRAAPPQLEREGQTSITKTPDFFTRIFTSTKMPAQMHPPAVWTSATFNSRRFQSMQAIHRGLLDSMRYARDPDFRNISDEHRAAYDITPPHIRVRQMLDRKQEERKEMLAEEFYAKYVLSLGPEAWEIQERQSWLEKHQVPMPARQRLPVPALEPLPAPRPPTPQPPSDVSDSEPEFQVPSTSAASDRSKKRRQVAQPVIPAHRPRPMTPAGSPINAPAAPVEQPEPVVAEQQPPQPEEVAPPRLRRQARRRQPVKTIDTADIQGRDLPDAPPTVVGLHVLVGQKLAKTDQAQVIRRLEFKAIRYGNGLVVAQGNLGGIILGNQDRNWDLVYNDPADPIIAMDAGDQHLLLLSKNGNIFTIGSNSAGQLGSSRRQGLQRRCQTTLTSIRRTVLLKRKMPNGRVKKEHAIFRTISAAGNTSSAITVEDDIFHCGDDLGPVFA